MTNLTCGPLTASLRTPEPPPGRRRGRREWRGEEGGGRRRGGGEGSPNDSLTLRLKAWGHTQCTPGPLSLSLSLATGGPEVCSYMHVAREISLKGKTNEGSAPVKLLKKGKGDLWFFSLQKTGFMDVSIARWRWATVRQRSRRTDYSNLFVRWQGVIIYIFKRIHNGWKFTESFEYLWIISSLKVCREPSLPSVQLRCPTYIYE